jgi:hypothetical protein
VRDNAVHRTFAAGDWYAVVGEQVTALVPAEARARVAGLWDLADGGASFEEVLDGLLVNGLSGLEGFALVGHGERTRVLVRGDVTATFSTAHGEIAMSHEPDSMWADRTLDGVTGGRITVGDAVIEPHLALVAGVARAGGVQFGEPASGSPVPVYVEEPIPFESAPIDPEPEPEPMVEPDVEPEPQPEAVIEVETEAMAVVEPEPVPAPAHSAIRDHSPYPTNDHDGQTTVGPPVEDFARPQVGIPGQELAPAVVARPVAKLIVSTGEVIDVDRVILVGRAPEARNLASSDQPHLVTVASPHHEISSTHLEIRPGAGADHGMAVVTDMGSTNGTVLVQPGLPPEDLQAGMAVSLIPGAILDLGDGVTIQTTNP